MFRHCPTDTILHVFSFLSNQELSTIRRVNSALHAIEIPNIFWFHRLQKDFFYAGESNALEYKKMYIKSLEQLRKEKACFAEYMLACYKASIMKEQFELLRTFIFMDLFMLKNTGNVLKKANEFIIPDMDVITKKWRIKLDVLMEQGFTNDMSTKELYEFLCALCVTESSMALNILLNRHQNILTKLDKEQIKLLMVCAACHLDYVFLEKLAKTGVSIDEETLIQKGGEESIVTPLSIACLNLLPSYVEDKQINDREKGMKTIELLIELGADIDKKTVFSKESNAGEMLMAGHGASPLFLCQCILDNALKYGDTDSKRYDPAIVEMLQLVINAKHLSSSMDISCETNTRKQPSP